MVLHWSFLCPRCTDEETEASEVRWLASGLGAGTPGGGFSAFGTHALAFPAERPIACVHSSLLFVIRSFIKHRVGPLSALPWAGPNETHRAPFPPPSSQDEGTDSHRAKNRRSTVHICQGARSGGMRANRAFATSATEGETEARRGEVSFIAKPGVLCPGLSLSLQLLPVSFGGKVSKSWPIPFQWTCFLLQFSLQLFILKNFKL